MNEHHYFIGLGLLLAVAGAASWIRKHCFYGVLLLVAGGLCLLRGCTG